LRLLGALHTYFQAHEVENLGRIRESRAMCALVAVLKKRKTGASKPRRKGEMSSKEECCAESAGEMRPANAVAKPAVSSSITSILTRAADRRQWRTFG
jgi:hypothetical protein